MFITSLWSSSAQVVEVEIQVYQYLNDWLFWDLSRQQVIVAIEKIQSPFQLLDLLINRTTQFSLYRESNS